MINESLQAAAKWMKRVLMRPRDELNRWQRTVRFGYDLMKYGGEQLRYDRAPQMAGALAFRSLFALLPVLVVTTIVVKGLKGTDAFLDLTRDVLQSAGLDQIRLIPATVDANGAAGDTSISLAGWLEGLVVQAMDVNLAAVGWIGFAVIIYASIGLMVTIENSFNTIFRAPEGRPWFRRVPLYWFVLTVSPVAIGVVWYLNGQFSEQMSAFISWPALLVVLRVLWSVLLVWLLIFAIYMLIPNSAVAIRPALFGALVAAVLLEIGMRFLGVYLENAFSISQLYGSLGLIPVFMFWVYVMWLFVLFGMEIAAILQTLRGRDLDEMRHRQAVVTGMFDPVSVVSIVEIVAERFADGQVTTARQIADKARIPEALVLKIVPRLVDAGILHRLESDDMIFTVASPPDQIDVKRLIDIGFEMVTHEPTSPLVIRIRNAQRKMAGDATLASLAGQN